MFQLYMTVMTIMVFKPVYVNLKNVESINNNLSIVNGYVCKHICNYPINFYLQHE